MYPPYLHILCPRSLLDFVLFCKLVPQYLPDMIRVPRVGTLLITLPSDSSSQRTPLRLANGWQLQASIADFHRQVTRHAWRTNKKYYKNYSTSSHCRIYKCCINYTCFHIPGSAISNGSLAAYSVTPGLLPKSKVCQLFITGDPKHISAFICVISNNIDHSVPKPSS